MGKALPRTSGPHKLGPEFPTRIFTGRLSDGDRVARDVDVKSADGTPRAAPDRTMTRLARSARPALPNEQRPCWETLLSSFRQKALLNAKARVRVATLFAIGEYLLICHFLLKLFCSQRRWS